MLQLLGAGTSTPHLAHAYGAHKHVNSTAKFTARPRIPVRDLALPNQARRRELALMNRARLVRKRRREAGDLEWRLGGLT